MKKRLRYYGSIHKTKQKDKLMKKDFANMAKLKL